MAITLVGILIALAVAAIVVHLHGMSGAGTNMTMTTGALPNLGASATHRAAA